MKLLLPICLILSATLSAQLSFKTVAPLKPIIEGESFQVQYVLQDAKKTGVVTAPLFKGFRPVSGPNIYYGSIVTIYGEQSLHNVVYTLEAVKPGVFIIQGATVMVNGKTIRSNDTQVEVISKEEALRQFNREHVDANSEYYLKPGEDPYKKIRENLFVKVVVNKKNCLVGEPVLATFKLYSRLESKSDIVKNPGLYGFTVYDMVNLADKESYAEKINGKIFDVHTIRKVQLYPLQAGQFAIDAMEVKNRVEFSVSAVNKHTEQEIVEGILSGDPNDPHPPGTEVFETYSSTEPVKIEVKPVPEKNKPALFSGALGNFSIHASTPKSEFLLNEQGFLELTLAGKGNFTQLDAPRVQWPAGIEGFDAKVMDQIDKMNIPLSGKRSFIYSFVGIKAGSFKLPPIQFSYFDPAANRYQVVQTDTLDITILPQKQPGLSKDEPVTRTNSILLLILGGLVAATVVTAFGLKRDQSKKRVKQKELMIQAETAEVTTLQVNPDAAAFYSNLYDAIWKIAAEKFQLKGSDMNKQVLAMAMKSRNIAADHVDELIELIRVCETGMYTTTQLDDNKEALIKRAERVIIAINQT